MFPSPSPQANSSSTRADPPSTTIRDGLSPSTPLLSFALQNATTSGTDQASASNQGTEQFTYIVRLPDQWVLTTPSEARDYHSIGYPVLESFPPFNPVTEFVDPAPQASVQGAFGRQEEVVDGVLDGWEEGRAGEAGDKAGQVKEKKVDGDASASAGAGAGAGVAV